MTRRKATRTLGIALFAALMGVAALGAAEGATPDRLTLQGGRLIVDPAPAAAADCPSGYVCLWQDTGFEGSMVGFQPCCVWFDLADYTFNNIASSWRNRKNVDAVVAAGAGGNGDRLCLNNNSMGSSMPSGWNDVPSSLRIRDDANHC
ncbi:MAG TPA: peptidase inhibitor family I36 protein [Actinomycetota bacterium]|nr:peptidase inhibitor family I36 protein [Actinomycetota bacterium]